MIALEKHYSPKEVAKIFGLSEGLVRRIFVDEPGVLQIHRPRLASKRPYTTLRIPESVMLRWHDQHSRGFVREVQRGRRAV